MLVLDGVEMMDVREIAEMVGRTPETVRRWIWSGRLTARPHGRKLLVARRDVEALMTPGGERVQTSLAEWAESAARQRQSGALGPVSPAASAADLVLDDRAHRQAG